MLLLSLVLWRRNLFKDLILLKLGARINVGARVVDSAIEIEPFAQMLRIGGLWHLNILLFERWHQKLEILHNREEILRLVPGFRHAEW